MQALLTLCFFVCVKRVRSGFAVPDGPPSDTFALGVIADTPLKQVKQSCHVRYRWPSCSCNFTAVDRADCISVALLWTSFTNSYCANADFCNLFVPIIDCGANAS